MSDRDRYRDDDDMRAPLEGGERTGVDPDSKHEARGDARETAGDNTRGTDASPTGPEGNDHTAHRPRRDEFDTDIERDNRARSDG